MKKEVSAGAVIYKLIDNKILYLIQYMSLGHISICKGHLENDETLIEGCKREIVEETSLNVLIDTDFHHIITYSPYEGIIKDVHFFVGKVMSNNNPIDTHDNEVIKMEFLPFDKAYKLLTHDSDKETLDLANQYILKKENL